MSRTARGRHGFPAPLLIGAFGGGVIAMMWAYLLRLALLLDAVLERRGNGTARGAVPDRSVTAPHLVSAGARTG